MEPEKSPTIYEVTEPFEEPRPKGKKSCSKTLLSIVLASLLIALIIALCVQFLVPIERTITETEIDTIRVFEGSSNPPQVNSEKNANTIPDPWELDFLINPTRLCETLHPPNSELYRSNPEISLLVLVPSDADHFEHRTSIRRTWGSVAEPSGPMRLGFVVGSTKNDTEENMLVEESEVHGDIIQVDVENSARNTTAKSILTLKWVSKHCSHAKYFLKTDDDTFVNMRMVAKILKKEPYRSPGRFISGFVKEGDKSLLSEESTLEDMPPYVAGRTYLTTGPTASDLFEATRLVRPFLPVDEMFVTGLCADEINADLFHEPGFTLDDLVRPFDWNSFSNIATAHSITPGETKQIWDQMNKPLLGSLNWAGNLFDDHPPRVFAASFPKFDFESSSNSDSDFFQSVFNMPEIKSMFNMMNNPFGFLTQKSQLDKPEKKPSIFDLFKIPDRIFSDKRWTSFDSTPSSSIDYDSEPVFLRARLSMKVIDPENEPHLGEIQVPDTPVTLPTVKQLAHIMPNGKGEDTAAKPNLNHFPNAFL